jgi:hypothetical protein
MRGWVIRFEDGQVTDGAVDNSGPRKLSKVSIFENRALLEGVDSVIPKVLVENIRPTGLDIIFRSADGQHADQADFGGAAEVEKCPIEGNVDVMTPWGASGWARFVDGRDEFVRVEVVLNGVVISEALACDFRPGLHDDDNKRKFCGFTFRFKTLLPADVDLTIRAVGSNGSAILSSGKPGGIEGYVDSVSKLTATGWAWMPLDAGRQLTIEARLGGRVVASAITHQLRDDIRKSGRGSGYCGFTMQFDPRLSDGDTPDFFAIGSAEEAPLASAESDAPEFSVATTAMEAAPVVENKTASTPSLDIEGRTS